MQLQSFGWIARLFRQTAVIERKDQKILWASRLWREF